MTKKYVEPTDKSVELIAMSAIPEAAMENVTLHETVKRLCDDIVRAALTAGVAVVIIVQDPARIVLASDAATFGEMRDLSVKPVLLSEGSDLREITARRVLSQKDVERAAALITRDHGFYHRKRAVRRAPMLPRPSPTT